MADQSTSGSQGILSVRWGIVEGAMGESEGGDGGLNIHTLEKGSHSVGAHRV